MNKNNNSNIPQNGGNGQAVYTLREVSEKTEIAYSTVCRYASKSGWTKQGVTTYLTEAQVTLMLEAMKTPRASGRLSNSLNERESVETEMSLDLQAAIASHKSEELWKKIAERNKKRAAEALEENRLLKSYNADLKSGLAIIQDMAETAGIIKSDKEDMRDTYPDWKSYWNNLKKR